VRGYGAVGDTNTNNDTAVNTLIAQVIASGGGTVYFDSDPFIQRPVYRMDQMIINGQGNIDLEIKAAPDVVIKPAPLSTTDFIIISSGSTSTTDGTFLRRLRLTDLVIQSQGHSMSGTKIDRRAITISQAQDVTLRNVKIAGFKRGALILTDCFDSYFNDVEIKWSGYGLDNSNYAHAIQFLGSLDNSNNNRFTNLHMEQCPMMMLFDNNSRQNSFVNSKFEDGTETEKNTSTISPFYFKQSIETMFTGGFFSVDYTSDVPVIRTDDNSNSYLTTYNVRQAVKFSNLLLFANSLNKARWFVGYNTEFSNVTVQRAYGSSAGFAFDFASRNTFRGGSITMATNDSNFFRITGDNNVLDKPTLVTFGDGAGASTAAITLSSGATRNYLDYLITGSVGNEFSAGPAFGTAGTLGNNIVVNARDNNASTSGGGQKNVLHKEYLKLTDGSAQTYTGFLNGFTGQKITIFATTANVTLQHGTTANAIAMKSGANVPLATNETRTFVNIDGVWREN